MELATEEPKESDLEKSRAPIGKNKVAALLVISIIVLAYVVTGWYQLQSKKALGCTIDFALTDVEGKVFRPSNLNGSVVVIKLMASWCPACRGMVPVLQEVWNKYKGQIFLISVSIDPYDTDVDLKNWANQSGANWTYARDTANIAHLFKVTYIPTLVIIDKNGCVQFTHVGLVSAQILSQEIDQLLEK